MKTNYIFKLMVIKALLLLLLLLPHTAYAGIYYISPTGNDSTGDGSYSLPFNTLQKAVNACDTVEYWSIYLLDGTYEFADTTYIDINSKYVSAISAYNSLGATIKNSVFMATLPATYPSLTLNGFIFESSTAKFTGMGYIYMSSNHLKDNSFIWADYDIQIIVNNNIFDNTNNGLQIASLYSSIYNNTFVRKSSKTGSSAINIDASAEPSIYANIFQNYGNVFGSGIGLAQNVTYNCFYNNDTIPVGLDTTNIIADPLLKSDFSLKTGSPCIGAYMGYDIGAVAYVAPVCSLYYTYVNNYGANFTFTPASMDCDTVTSYSWTIYDYNSNILISGDKSDPLTYNFPEVGYYSVYLDALKDTNIINSYGDYVYVESTCKANGTLDTLFVDKKTGFVKFSLKAVNTDSVKLNFGDNVDTTINYTGAEMIITHNYTNNSKMGTSFSPSYTFINGADSCSVTKYFSSPIEIINKNCAVFTSFNSDTLVLSMFAERYSMQDNVLVTLENSQFVLDTFTLSMAKYMYNQNYEYTQAGYDTMYVKAQGTYCSSVDTVPVYIWGYPCPSASVEKTFINDTTYNFVVHGLGSGYAYYWYFSSYKMDTSFVTTDSTLKMELPIDDYIYYEVNAYNEKNDCNTGWMYEYFVTGTLNCYSSFSYGTDSIGKTFAFYNYSPEGKNYKWDFGDGSTSTDFEPSHTFTKDGIYKVTLTVLDEASNCVQSFSSNITIGTVNCKADFTSSVSGLTATFTNISTGVQETYWSFGDYGYSYERSPVHTYAEAGIYDVYLYIYNGSSESSCWDEITKTIKVGNVKDVITSEFDYYTTDDSVYYFSDISKGNPTSRYWKFGDGTISTESYVKKTFKYPDIYNVCLTVQNADSSISTSCQDVWVGGYECTANAEFGYRLNGKQVTFTDKSTGTFDKYYWDFGDGTTSSAKNPVYSYDKEGFYYVILTVRKANTDCTSSYGEYILIGNSNCRADFTYTVNPTKLTADLKFSGKASANTYYYWAFDDGEYSEEASITKQFLYPGLHYVMLAIYDETSVCMDYIEKEIQVGEVQCSAGFTYYVDATNNKAWCTNTSKGDSLYYFWDFGDGKYSTDKNPTHFFNYAGYYTISLTVYNDNWCMDYSEEVVTITGKGIDCEADFAAMVNNETLEVTFSDKSKGDISNYFWDYGDYPDPGYSELASPAPYKFQKAGMYNVCLVVWNNEGTSNMTCKTIKVGSDDAINCEAKFIYSIDSITQKMHVFNKSLGQVKECIWNFGETEFTTAGDTAYTYSTPGYYLVSLTINTEAGCSSTAYNYVNVSMRDTILCKFGYNIDESKQKAGGYPVDFIGAGLGDQARLKWDYGDGTTDSTSTSPTHEYTTADTTYNVCYTIIDPITNDSAKYCEPVEVKKTGVKTITDKSGYTVYPNPAKDNITAILSIKQATTAKVEICDLSGRSIMNLNNKLKLISGKNNVPLNISNLQYGSYILRFTTANGDVFKKMIVKQ